MDHAWVDGEVVGCERAQVSAFDRTLLYGLGAFETFRLWGGVPFRIERHLARLRRSLATLELPEPALLDQLVQGVPALSRACAAPDALCRVTVTAGGAADGPPAPPRVLAMLRGAPGPLAGRRVVVGLAPVTMEASSPIAGVKSTSYLTHYLLRERAEAGGRVDDVLLDSNGHVGEATVSTVFAVRDGVLATTPLSVGVLEGVTRGEIMAQARALGIPVEERAFTLEELRGADECFLTGAGKCLASVDELVGQELPAARPVTAALSDALAGAIAEVCGVDRARVRF